MTRKFAHDVVLSEKSRTCVYTYVMYMDGCVCVSVEAIITIIREHTLFLGTRLFSRLHSAYESVLQR